MNVTIEKINRQIRQGKKGDYESLGLAVKEETLLDINGDEFKRDGRWLSGFGKKGVTDSWAEGDKVKVNILRVKGKKQDGTEAEFLNFRLPEGVDPMVEKGGGAHVAAAEVVGDPNDF